MGYDLIDVKLMRFHLKKKKNNSIPIPLLWIAFINQKDNKYAISLAVSSGLLA